MWPDAVERLVVDCIDVIIKSYRSASKSRLRRKTNQQTSGSARLHRVVYHEHEADNQKSFKSTKKSRLRCMVLCTRKVTHRQISLCWLNRISHDLLRA